MKFITNKINIQAQSTGGFFSDLMKGIGMNAGLIRPGDSRFTDQGKRVVPRYDQSVPQPNFPNMDFNPNQAQNVAQPAVAPQQNIALPATKTPPQLAAPASQLPAAATPSPTAPTSGGAAALPAAKSPIITPPPTAQPQSAPPAASSVSLTPEQQRISQDVQQQIKSLTPDEFQLLIQYMSRNSK